jgi:hypothetical protein
MTLLSVCVCVSVCLCIPPINFWTPEQIFMELGTYIYQGTWPHLKGLIKKSLPSVWVSVYVTPYRC